MKTYLYQINVTRACNLRCTHCYIASEVKDVSKSMNVEQLVTLVRQIADHTKKIGYDTAEIHVLGGEPTMLGLAFYEEAMPQIRAVLAEAGIAFDLSLVSNLLQPDALPIGKLFDRVSSSYEPDTRFLSWNGKLKPALERKWRDQVRLFQDAGVKISVTSCITRGMVDAGAAHMLDLFYRNNIKQVHLGFYIPEGDGLKNKDSIFPEFGETSQFLCDAADWYLAKRESDPDLWINPVESMLRAIDSEAPQDDVVCPMLTGSMDIHWDGNVVSCLEAGGSTKPQWSGNVFTEGVAAVAESDGFKREVRFAQRIKKPCVTCDQYRICKAGCSVLFNYWDADTSGDCPGFRRFLLYLRKLYVGGVRPKGNAAIFKGC